MNRRQWAGGAGIACVLAAMIGVSAQRVSPAGSERQPEANRGGGRFVNPVVPGEFPDPSVVRVGDDYYLTHTPGRAVPGLLVWHSRDLVNWEPIGPALTRPVGDVWAPDFVHLDGLYYIYFPALVTDSGGRSHRTNFVVTAKAPAGPWTDPIDLHVAGIDPGHVVDTNGRRYLYLDGGMMAPLSADGLRVTAPPTKVYDGWPIPPEWNIECKCLESPKLFRRGPYYYLVSAQGGTAGPSTSHMAVVARASSPTGPWENMPANPLVRTSSRAERWWSQGHATLVDAPDGSWWMVFHAFEHDFRTLGRQTLLLPIEWTSDGWPRVPAGVTASQALASPPGSAVPNGLARSDAFAGGRPGLQWRWWDARDQPKPASSDGIQLTARGAGIADAALLTMIPVNHAYEVDVEVDASAGAAGGLALHYDDTHATGLSVGQDGVAAFHGGNSFDRVKWPAGHGGRAHLRIRNIEHDVRLSWSLDGRGWQAFERGLELSGYHHDTFGNWGTLKVALFATGNGTVTFRQFHYQGQ